MRLLLLTIRRFSSRQHRWLISLLAGVATVAVPLIVAGGLTDAAWLLWEISPFVLLGVTGHAMGARVWIVALTVIAVIVGYGEAVALTNDSSTASLLLITLPLLPLISVLTLFIVETGRRAGRELRAKDAADEKRVKA